MKRKKSTPEQIVKKLRQAQVEIAKGATVEQVSRKLGITEQTYYRWKREYGGMEVDQLGRLKEPRARERPAEEDRCRAGDGHRRAEGHRLKKMVSPRGRRRAVEYLRTQHYSERRACRLVGQPRSTQRYCGKPPSEKSTQIRKRILRLARKFPRYGHRRLTAELRREGWMVNRKCVRRICREGLRSVPCTAVEFARYDAILISTPHRQFKDAALYKDAKVVIDTRNIVPRSTGLNVVRA